MHSNLGFYTHPPPSIKKLIKCGGGGAYMALARLSMITAFESKIHISVYLPNLFTDHKFIIVAERYHLWDTSPPQLCAGMILTQSHIYTEDCNLSSNTNTVTDVHILLQTHTCVHKCLHTSLQCWTHPQFSNSVERLNKVFINSCLSTCVCRLAQYPLPLLVSLLFPLSLLQQPLSLLPFLFLFFPFHALTLCSLPLPLSFLFFCLLSLQSFSAKHSTQSVS